MYATYDNAYSEPAFISTLKTQDLNKYSSLLKILEVSTDKETLVGTKDYYSHLLEQEKLLLNEKVKKQFIVEGISTLNFVKTNIEKLNAFINKFDDVVFDDDNVKKLIFTLNKIYQKIDYLLDYLDLALKTKEAVNEIKKQKPMSFKELEKHIITA